MCSEPPFQTQFADIAFQSIRFRCIAIDSSCEMTRTTVADKNVLRDICVWWTML